MASIAGVTFLTGAAAVLSVARGIVLALTHLIAIGAPAVWWTIYIARLPRITLIAATGLWRNTYAMLASDSTCRYTPISLLVLLVPSAALFQYPLLGYASGFVYGLCLDAIC